MPQWDHLSGRVLLKGVRRSEIFIDSRRLFSPVTWCQRWRLTSLLSSYESLASKQTQSELYLIYLLLWIINNSRYLLAPSQPVLVSALEISFLTCFLMQRLQLQTKRVFPIAPAVSHRSITHTCKHDLHRLWSFVSSDAAEPSLREASFWFPFHLSSGQTLYSSLLSKIWGQKSRLFISNSSDVPTGRLWHF